MTASDTPDTDGPGDPGDPAGAPNAPNVDPAEIDKFDPLASRWWDPQGELKPLHQVNPLRLDFIAKHANIAGARALDVGCGGGILTEALAQRGAEATGIDASAAPLEVARLHALESGAQVDYRRITAEELAAQRRGDWDIVCCLELLEHVPDPARLVAACATLARPGGALFFSTLNRNPKAFLLAIVGAEYVLGLLPRGTHRYEKLIRPSELGRWCERAGATVRDLTGLHYNPLRDSFALGPGVDVNYIAYATAADAAV
ncbi:MAG: bifunctional 2-polyprenyl-6-hydroxyphenol methylase/3-demethylubiquinol 3-O-methyltransferase UbiG [Gammaproteobacteria bacterium]|nr:bifunctional 2-polyprenyl-6-hydroxyphenol methylase/3-demethylubiquinol 3-O-methyltransferase UbiG [Gammaproteobacteria bacterium]